MTTPTEPFTFDETTVVLANPAQRRRTREHTFPEWGAGKGFDLESYCRRDEVMAEETGGYDTWVLVPRKSLDTVDEILASCETYRRRSIVRQTRRKRTSHDRDDDHQEDIGLIKEEVEVSNIAISCVYVNPLFSGHHYARHLLQLMHYILAPKEDLPEFPKGVWGEAPEVPKGWKGDAAFSVLYSGIGGEYYTKARQGHGPDSRPGWDFVPSSRGRVWKILNSSTNIDQIDSHDGSTRQDDSEAEDEGRWLTADDVRAIEPLADEEVRRQVDEVEVGDDVVMAVLPSGDTLYQHCLRDQLSPTGMTLGRPRTYGYVEPPSLDSSTTLSAADNNDSDLPFFTYRFRTGLQDPQRLCITFVRHPVPWTSVLRAALKEGCGSVEIWGEAGDVWVKEGAGEPEVEDPTVCLVNYRWSDLGLRWVVNERYGWC